MKIKRLTFTKLTVRMVCYIIPLLILYHYTPVTINYDGKGFFIFFTIIVWEICRLLERALLKDNYEKI
jgi:hypothetical protein